MDSNDILEKLEERILKACEEIANQKPGTTEYTELERTIVELTAKYTELEEKVKSRMRSDEDTAVKEREYADKLKQQKRDNTVEIVKIALEHTGKVLAVVLMGCGFAYGIAWEKNDRFSSQIFKNVLKDIIRFKL